MFASAQYDRADPDTLDGAGDAYLVFGMPWRGGFGRPASELPGEGRVLQPLRRRRRVRPQYSWNMAASTSASSASAKM
ncbi:MAG: hypothetical protein R3B94_08335 [Hyphomonas sp.]